MTWLVSVTTEILLNKQLNDGHIYCIQHVQLRQYMCTFYPMLINVHFVSSRPQLLSASVFVLCEGMGLVCGV